jgi:HK97 family phage portal protein
VIDISNAFPNATAEQVEAIRQKYVANYTGSANAGKPIVKTNKIEMTALDSGLQDNRATQLIENRQFQESEIGKMFPIALSILKGDNKYGSLEQLYMLFVDTCLKPICNVFEESFQKLLPLSDRGRLYCEYNYNSLLKTDLNTRIETYNKQIYSGILSINEVRAKENLMPIEAGDTHWMPANNIPIRQDVEDAMLASAKLKAQELLNPNPANNIGSDKI